MNIATNYATYGIGTNPRGGAFSLVALREDEISQIQESVPGTGNAFRIFDTWFFRQRWSPETHHMWIAKVYHRAVSNPTGRVPLDGGENPQMDIIGKLSRRLPVRKCSSEQELYDIVGG